MQATNNTLESTLLESSKPLENSANKFGKETKEQKQRIEYTDLEIERAHEVLGISGIPYLMLESDANKFQKRNVDVSKHLKQHDTSFLAPGAMSSLFMGNKYCNLNVEIGKNSNIQEIEKVKTSQGQNITIKIGEGSSLAHAVILEFPKGRGNVGCEIGDNVFVGIGTNISECKIGNNCSIGFKCRLKRGVEVGDFVTVCDGAVIKGDLKLPSFTVVPPGIVVHKTLINNPALTPEEYVKKARSADKPLDVLIKFSPEQQEKILKAEEEKKGQGNVMSNKILEDAGVYASSLTLTKFNRIVVSENRLFPLMYRLLEKFHPEQINSNDRSSQGEKYGKNVMIMNLPVNRSEFLKHYMDQVENGIEEANIKPYIGEFTKCDVDWDKVSLEGDTYLIGEVEIKGKTVIGQRFTYRGDEMKPGSKVKIDECTFGEGITIHAVNEKHFKKVDAGNNCVFHGKVKLERCKIGNSLIVHNVEANNCHLHGNTIILGANLLNASVGKTNTLIGHDGEVNLKQVSTGDSVVILHSVRIEGDSTEKQIWIDDNCRINHNCVIAGSGDIERGKVFGPNGCFQIIGAEIKKIAEIDIPSWKDNLKDEDTRKLANSIHGSVTAVIEAE